MWKIEMLRRLLNERLSAAVEEILVVYQRTIEEYEEELNRTKEQQRLFLEGLFKNPSADLQKSDISEVDLQPEQHNWSYMMEEPLKQMKAEEPSCNNLDEEKSISTLSLTNVKNEVECQSDSLIVTPQAAGNDNEDVSSKAPRIKEEEDEHDIGIDFPVIHVVIKGEDDKDRPQSSQCHSGETALISSDYVTAHSLSTDDAEYLNTDGTCHADKKNLTCSICGRTLYDKKTLKVHMRTHTGERPFICTVCGKAFAQRGNLIKHTRTHTGEKPFTCPVCSTSFSDSSTLVKHIRRHTGEKPFCCPLCGERFSRKSNLTTHTRTHTGEKPFACSVCGTTFSDRSTLNKHMRTHTGEKPFSCSVCGQRFTQKGHMTTHTRRHTGEKPFECSVCHTSFSDRSTFVRHVRRHSRQPHLPASEEMK
ncbi:zinc finger protein OZF-like [Corythoichthys intestinalis]|uniref:zinc finger protein OZF-like n=1 Tax=Corythoichthys intestinalis TaxID=161448 RepID=UPI0025A507A2|nr:zinc finger protein OZF-like [Corythoichthys intestinalis]